MRRIMQLEVAIGTWVRCGYKGLIMFDLCDNVTAIIMPPIKQRAPYMSSWEDFFFSLWNTENCHNFMRLLFNFNSRYIGFFWHMAIFPVVIITKTSIMRYYKPHEPCCHEGVKLKMTLKKNNQ